MDEVNRALSELVGSIKRTMAERDARRIAAAIEVASIYGIVGEDGEIFVEKIREALSID